MRQVFLPVLLLLAGCSQSGHVADLDDYLGKLERVLEQGAHPLGERSIAPLPAVRELRHEEQGESIDLLEFLQIRECRLGSLVAERNSSLGKLAESSQRLVYELRFLEYGQACVDRIDDEHPELASTLARVLETKRDALPGVIFAATLGGPEFRTFWQPGPGDLPADILIEPDVTLAVQTLREDVKRWLAGDYKVEPDQLESILESIRRGQGGLVLRSWMLLSNHLEVATGILRDRLARRPLCYDNMQTPTADIFENVVKGEFIGRIQPWAAQLNKAWYALMPDIESVEQMLEKGEPAAYITWRTLRDEDMDWARGTLSRHVDALNPLLDQCNMLPARGVADGSNDATLRLFAGLTNAGESSR